MDGLLSYKMFSFSILRNIVSLSTNLDNCLYTVYAEAKGRASYKGDEASIDAWYNTRVFSWMGLQGFGTEIV